MNEFAVRQIEAHMINVTGGQFTMGDTDKLITGLFARKINTTLVELSDFHISDHPVTVGEWAAIMDECCDPDKANLPKVNVSWHDAWLFVEKLNRLTGWHYRLPTEAEWEYAARGGELSRHTNYSGGHILETLGWYRMNSRGYVHEVSQKESNELGLYDMSGNIREWCQDIYQREYPQAFDDSSFFGLKFKTNRRPLVNPTGALSGNTRVVRGGSYLSSDKECWVFYRDSLNSTSSKGDVGFRLAY